MEKKILYIVRGVSGCGKTTTANSIVGEKNVATADEYFYTNGGGKYEFDASKLGEAHKFCQLKVRSLMKMGEPEIAVANTSTRSQDVKTYIKIADEYGYMPIVFTVENWHGGVNSHGVPEKGLEKMANQLKNSIRLK